VGLGKRKLGNAHDGWLRYKRARGWRGNLRLVREGTSVGVKWWGRVRINFVNDDWAGKGGHRQSGAQE